MSIVSDAIRLFNRESAAFAFLPAINYLYIYWEAPSSEITDLAITVGALFISAIAFNVLKHVDFEPYLGSSTTNTSHEAPEPDENKVLGLGSLVILILITGIWTLFLISSLVPLWGLFTEAIIWAGILFGLSILFICLVVSDLLLSVVLPVYE